MVDETEGSGLLLKHRGEQGYENIRLISLGLREATRDSEGYYIKADGVNEFDEMDQIYLYLRGSDVVDVIAGWIEAIQKDGMRFEKWLLADVLQSLASTAKRGCVNEE